jgi:Fe-S-cluster-containing dehydrogenase component
MKNLILVDQENCQGCRICETACGFHHTGHKEFNPGRSSTRVSRDNDTGKITLSIDSICDGCQNEEIPLCVKYCAYGVRGVVKR